MKLNKFINFNYSNHKSSTCKIFYPTKIEDLHKVIIYAKKNNLKILTIGTNLSWYDTIFNSQNILISLKKFKKKFILNRKKKIISVSAAYKIDEILKKIKKYNLSLYSIPGGSNVTIGGCIGNDVHGKDSFRYGNFGENVIELKVLLSNNKIIKCSKVRNSKIYHSIIGGLGLIGIVIEAKLRLKEISKIYLTNNFICKDYKELIETIYDKNERYDYVNGWVDILSKNRRLGNGIIFKSKQIKNIKKLTKKNINTINLISKIQNIIFKYLIKNNLVFVLNFLIKNLFKIKKKNYNDYENVTYPLSSYGVDIKEAIKPYSFFEIQIIIKKKKLPTELKNFILKCQELELSGFVIGIKMHKKNNNLLSFADNGISININQIFDKNNYDYKFNKIKILHNYVLNKGHKIYLCKDFCMNNKDLRKNYSKAREFFEIKKKIDPRDLFSSDFYQRVKK